MFIMMSQMFSLNPINLFTLFPSGPLFLAIQRCSYFSSYFTISFILSCPGMILITSSRVIFSLLSTISFYLCPSCLFSWSIFNFIAPFSFYFSNDSWVDIFHTFDSSYFSFNIACLFFLHLSSMYLSLITTALQVFHNHESFLTSLLDRKQ